MPPVCPILLRGHCQKNIQRLFPTTIPKSNLIHIQFKSVPMLLNQHACCGVLLLFLIGSCTTMEVPRYTTALIVYQEFDKSRRFDTTVKSSSHSRPVKIDVFYPSTGKPKGSALTYGDIFDMYEMRLNYAAPIDSCKKSSLQLANAIAEYLITPPQSTGT